MSQRKLPAWMANTGQHNSGDVLNSNQAKIGAKTNKCGEIAGIPFLEFEGEIIYCYQTQECNAYCEDILETSTFIGFDIEWKVTYETGLYNKTATIQLCTGEKKCYVFHIIHMTNFPIVLKSLLEASTIQKVGVGISGDISRLHVDYKVVVNGLVDLAVVANDKLGNNEKWSLNNLLLNQAHKQLNKENSLRCSNWEKLPLTPKQLNYAALDAYAGWYLYQVLLSK